MTNKDFKALADRLLDTYRVFCLNEVLHEKVNSELYKNFISTWNTILLGLEQDYMMGLARFFERPHEIDKTLSIYSFLDYQFREHEDNIKKIMNWRNKFFAHHDTRTSRNSKSFLAQNKLNREDIKKLFNTIIEIVSGLGNNFSSSGLKQKFEQTREKTRKECEKWLKPFNKDK